MSGSPQTGSLPLWGVKLFTWSVTFVKMRDFLSYLNKTKQISKTGALFPRGSWFQFGRAPVTVFETWDPLCVSIPTCWLRPGALPARPK